MEEIERILKKHPAVNDAVVVVREDEQTNQNLVAYLVKAKEREQEQEKEFRSFLKEILPEYMIPNLFVFLPKLPLTANGKTDRKALPIPNQEKNDINTSMALPQNEIERIVASLFSEVLHKKIVGRDEDFFESGGHSLVATQLIARLRNAFEVDIPLVSIFESSTVAVLSDTIAKLLAKDEIQAVPPLKALSNDAETVPLSFAQQRLWFLDQLEPNSPIYNMPFAIRIKGILDRKMLEKALSEIILRHKALRTTFLEVDGEAVQKIHHPSNIKLPVVDLRRYSESEREAKACRLAKQEAKKPFNLEQGPLIRATLVQLQDNDHLFIFNIHHIVYDGWSRGVFISELTTLYQVFTEGRPSPLEDLPVQYPDYSVWQRQWLRDEVLDKQLNYWRSCLDGELPQLLLPTDRPRTVGQTFNGAIHTVKISLDLTERLQELSAREGSTLFMTLLAAYNTLLYRYTQQEDILVGTAIANRNHPELEKLIGFFVNTLVMRTDLSGNPSFRELLKRVRKMALQAYAHQDLPFEKLVEELCPDRDASHSPLFKVMFSLHNTPQHKWELPNLTITAMDLESETAKFDMNVEVTEEEDGLTIALEYNVDLFDKETIERFGLNFCTLLEQIVQNPKQTISDIPILTDEQKRELLDLCGQNGSLDWGESEEAIHHVFEKQAQDTPHRKTLTFEGKSLTYEQLNEQANQLAHYLRKKGMTDGARIAVCLERSAEMVVTLLAILKAGGVYVPLDPHYPKERLTYMVEDADPALWITREKFLNHIPSHQAEPIVYDETLAEELKVEDKRNLSDSTPRSSLAYIMYTSGSTGQPKGVCVTHRGVVSLVKETEFIPFSPHETWLQFAPVSFDAATFEIWGSLLNGAELVVFPPYLPSLEELGAFIQEQQITVLWLTSGLFNQMVDYNLSSLCQVRYLIAGGDVLSVPHVRKALQELPECQLNMISVWKVTGELNIVVLKDCLDEIVRRHGSLRTIFVDGSEGPVQKILPSLALPFSVVHLEEKPRDTRYDQAYELAKKEAHHSFNLETGPLIRVNLVQLSNKNISLL
ncbi:AMP-binding protein [Paenactinomyces guangxiensis]|uniref:AMP-binding protein n=1 Tax=Paenactinomyces guangxiensis TaxID=1490290 RepID=A0A7W1WSS4_9BACL|nr:AMP-binding protein [Paenactinomyces guangxiensis]MBH8592140.1 AMP-binding protein [Paenactinomyces guangxiensis]